MTTNQIQVGKTDPLASGGGINSGNAYFPMTACPVTGHITGVFFGVGGADPGAQVVISSKDPAGDFTLVSSMPVPVKASGPTVATIPVSIPVTAGQYVGIYLPHASGYENTWLGGTWYTAGLPGTCTPSTSGGFDAEFGYVVSDGQRDDKLFRLRAELAQCLDGSPLILIGDSISAHFYSSSIDTHWFTQLHRWLNQYSAPNDQVEAVLLQDDGPDTAAFYGLTISGPVTFGAAGPIARSTILAAGSSVSFTGALAEVDVFYTQKAGAGSLEISYNGGAPYRTINCAGPADLDHYSGPSATAQLVAGTYKIKAMGGPIELTGLIRRGAVSAGGLARINTMRHAHGGYLLDNFGPDQVASIAKQASFAGGANPRILLALGTNDMFALTPTEITTKLTALIGRLRSVGLTDIWGIPMMRPTSAWDPSFTSGKTYDGALCAVRGVYQALGVPVIPLDGANWINQMPDLQHDGLHPSDAGEDRYFEIVTGAWV